MDKIIYGGLLLLNIVFWLAFDTTINLFAAGFMIGMAFVINWDK